MGTPETGEELSGGNGERIYVSVRLRPMNAKEILRNDVSDWECVNDNTIVHKSAGLSAPDRSLYPTAYTFDRVFRSDCSTREVYEQGAKDVAIAAVSGMNASVFAYGQTSSGKTYTMCGITEYAIADVYGYIQKHPERQFILKFSAMEIYNESVRDLLSVDVSPLRLLDDPERGTIVEKLTEETLRDWNHVIELLSLCEAQRQIGETSLNEMSSRSHQIIRLTIESSSREFLGRENASTLSATVNFVDLAGSERASQSLSAGTRLKEGCHINRSLLTLGTVIRKLSKGRNGHIPYRDSKLTRILQTSLGGNARTAIICTLSPARSHVEQSRNTLLFASCAKEVTTNAQVNVVMSDKALVKYLQRELARLESELRSPQSSPAPSNFLATLREKDLQIQKLEEEINDLILQRDIARSQVKDLLQLLGDDANAKTGVMLRHYPHLRLQRSPSTEIQEQETSILEEPHTLNDTRTCSDGHSRASSQDHIVEVPYFNHNYSHIRNSCESYSYNGWEDIEKQSNGTSEDLCKDVRCIETEDLSSEGANESTRFSSHEHDRFSADNMYVNGDGKTLESPSTLSENDRRFNPFPMENNTNLEDKLPGIATPKGLVKMIPTSLQQDKDSLPPLREEEKEISSIDLQDTSSRENYLFSYELDQDSSLNRRLRLTRSKSCKASIADSSSPWFTTLHFSENIPSLGSERESINLNKKLSPITCDLNSQSLSRKDFLSSPGDAIDIKFDTPNLKSATSEGVISCITDAPEIAELSSGYKFMETSKNIEAHVDESPKKNVKDVGLDPIEDEHDSHSSWPMEFKRIKQEIIEHWHACNASLIHRTYFFILFQGDPSDAIYLEVEMRRMKFLKDKFLRGGKTIVNGRRLTLASSARALGKERQMLSQRMTKKLTEQEREGLFLKWGIGLSTKHRRLQLAHRLWTNTEDMNHISDSAFLVAKLVGLVEPGQAPDKEMFGLNFTPRCSTKRSYSFSSLISLL